MPAIKGEVVSGECSAEKSLAERQSQLVGEGDSQRNSETPSLVSFVVGKHLLINKHRKGMESVPGRGKGRSLLLPHSENAH